MANVWEDPSQFVPFVNPNGETFSIPTQFAGAFNLPPPPDVTVPSPGAPPTFEPAEIAPPLPPAAPAVPSMTPAPAPVLPLPGPAPSTAVAAAQPTATPLPVPAPPPKQEFERPAAGPPPTALEMGMGALADRKDVAARQGDVNARAAEAEAGIYAASDEREAKLEEDRKVAREQEAKERAKYQAEVKDATDRYVNYKVDENRAWNNLGTGRKLLAGIGVLMAGLGNAFARKGNASNGALDFIMQTLKEDAASQRDERGQLRDAIGVKKDALNDLRAQFTDNEAAFQAELGANTKRVANQIRTMGAAAKTETAKLNAEDGAAMLDAEAAKLLDSAANTEYARRIDERNFTAEQRYRGASLAEQRAGRIQSQKNADRAFAQGAYEFDKNFELAVGRAEAEAEKLRREGKVKEAEAADKKAKEMRQEAVFSPRGEPLMQKDGTPWMTGDSARTTALRNQVANTSKMTAMADRLLRLRRKHGWTSDLANSPEFQEMKQVFADMQLTEKDVRQLGAISGSDLTLLSNVLGAEDPTQYKDPTAAVQAFRDGSVRNVNKYLRGQGYNGKAVDFPSLAETDPYAAAEDDPKVKSLLGYDETKRSVLGGRSTAIPRIAGSPVISPDSPYAKHFRAYTDGQQEQLRAFADDAAEGSERARVNLEVIAKESTVPELRELAASTLKSIDSGAYTSRRVQLKDAVSKVRSALGYPVTP
jgi:hypothetical protein